MADLFKIIKNGAVKGVFILALLLMVFGYVGIKQPNTIFGIVYFQFIYGVLGPEKALPIYQGTLSLSDKGALPDHSDRYLVRQLFDSNASEPQKKAIISFYLDRVDQPASTYMQVHRREITRHILSLYSSYPPAKQLSALILLQELNTGHSLQSDELSILSKAFPQASAIVFDWENKQMRGCDAAEQF